MARSQVRSRTTVRFGHCLFDNSLLRDTYLIPLHRKVCRPSGSEGQGPSEESRLNGHAAPIGLVQSFNDWVTYTHEYAIKILMNAAVQLRGGVAANFATPAIVVFKLIPVDEPANPSCAFRLSAEVPWILQGDDLHEVIRGGWETLDAACQRQAEEIRTYNPHLCYAGSLPAMIHVEGTRIAAFHPYPVYAGVRPRNRMTGPLEGLACGVVFEQVVAMVIGTMNAGLVLRAPACGYYARSSDLRPDVGALVKQKKKWVWKRQEDWIWNCSVELHFRQELLDPHLVWSAFYVLCYSHPDTERKHVAPIYAGTCVTDKENL